jgi:hypothetical protein
MLKIGDILQYSLLHHVKILSIKMHFLKKIGFLFLELIFCQS